ncbi:hypothetical protein Acr_02g0011770 [Actinidia rufa]|uniref:Uncharacterized protein n=1 Tax=Actinidia rufa TaxID=165716 RepID=A0A7J0EBA3_9ERIC|nr:hypothetical protein Acr_02g0011770 [Actinidia rufa]
MPPRQRPIQDVMENERIVRLQQLVENLADSVATMQIQIQIQQQQQQQQQYPNPRVAERGEEDNVESDEEENPFVVERQPEQQAGGQPRYHRRVEGREAVTISNRHYSLRGKQSDVLVLCPGLDLVVRVWPNRRLSEVEAQLGVWLANHRP